MTSGGNNFNDCFGHKRALDTFHFDEIIVHC